MGKEGNQHFLFLGLIRQSCLKDVFKFKPMTNLNRNSKVLFWEWYVGRKIGNMGEMAILWWLPVLQCVLWNKYQLLRFM